MSKNPNAQQSSKYSWVAKTIYGGDEAPRAEREVPDQSVTESYYYAWNHEEIGMNEIPQPHRGIISRFLRRGGKQ